jgi:hypothetical protein
VTELQQKYAHRGPISESNHADLMARINTPQARRAIDVAVGCNYAEVLLYALGRIVPTPDAEMPLPADVGGMVWTGD